VVPTRLVKGESCAPPAAFTGPHVAVAARLSQEHLA
jgi:hypothetical protein